MQIGPDVPNSYYRVSVKALITNDARELLVVRERDTWDLPGGGLEWGEDLHEALRREIREEINCELEIEEQPILIVPSVSHPYRQHALWIVYRAKLDRESHQIDSHYEVKYMTIDEFERSDPAEEAKWDSPVNFFEALRKLI